MANGSKIDAFNSPSRRSQLDNLYHSSGDPDVKAAAAERRMQTKAYRNDVRDTRSNDPQVRAAAYKRIAEKSDRPGFQAPAAIPTSGQYNQQDIESADKFTAEGKRLSGRQAANELEKDANKRIAPSSATVNAPAGEQATGKKSFADQEAEARQKSALSGAFGKEAQQLAQKQELFTRMQNATAEERGGSLRNEAKSLGVSDKDYQKAQEDIFYRDVKTESSPPEGSFSQSPSSSASTNAPVNQARVDINQLGLDEAINRYHKRSANAGKAQAEDAGKNVTGKTESVDQEISRIMEAGRPTISAPTRIPEGVDFGPVLAQSAANKQTVAARQAEIDSFVPPSTPISQVDTRSNAERLGSNVSSDIDKVLNKLSSLPKTDLSDLESNDNLPALKEEDFFLYNLFKDTGSALSDFGKGFQSNKKKQLELQQKAQEAAKSNQIIDSSISSIRERASLLERF